MNRTTEILAIHTVEQVPKLETIRAIPRNRTLKLVFEKEVQAQREVIGQNLKNQLLDFQVGIHTIEPVINISKLITDKEIEDNQAFFEQCAKDYRQLGEELIYKLVDELNLELNKDFPLETFNQLIREKRGKGQVSDWTYYVHGFHCSFNNIETGQYIEVSLVFGLEFGVLDPLFFMDFVKSTSKYHPLPVGIFEDYADGLRINQRMLSLGKFERIKSNIGNLFGTVVTER
ncbi:DUF6896 domain-containing protein [Flectobacillus rivi]|uniref:DUF6896 domain-containing protein n=1 Tax=Flectobacillus rivi TaxID=2984209 RepID=A0ABT6Z9Y3_9BACT|nr:hypothetical protein [Flectobacillus rivi]MDI9877765.1 hypothetical protein [Flectobacillus rivi]